MNTYELTTVEETSIIGTNISSTTYTLPVDGLGNVPANYMNKFRVVKDNQMLVFDTEQEYRDWIQQNT